MGGSFGGYMANWVAGHTDRFRAIVTHASLWALDQFGPTTDDGVVLAARDDARRWRRRTRPHRYADAITHADARDPRRQGLPRADRRGAAALVRARYRQADPTSPPHRFLYFPDENHWVLKPQHAIVWYQTVFAFLGEHVRGEPFEVPDLLR